MPLSPVSRPIAPRNVSPKDYNPTPFEMRPLVLDYLCHHGYTRAAKAFAADFSPKVIDADGEEVSQLAEESDSNESGLSSPKLKHIERREEVRHAIQCGRIEDAVALLDKYFPSVLSKIPQPPMERPSDAASVMAFTPYTSVDPFDLSMNLKIQQFIEDCRTIPLPYPPPSDPTSAPEPKPQFPDGSPEILEQQTALLKSAQKLYEFVRIIPDPDHKAEFLRQLSHVGGVLAYKVPEKSSLAKYFSQDRRDAVAQQIVGAIHYRTGHPAISHVEHRVRQTSVAWSLLNQRDFKPRPGIPLPPMDDPSFVTPKVKQPSGDKKPSDKKGEKDNVPPVPPFDLRKFLETRD